MCKHDMGAGYDFIDREVDLSIVITHSYDEMDPFFSQVILMPSRGLTQVNVTISESAYSL